MKIPILSVLLFFLFATLNGQTNPALIGTWKIVSINTNGLYYNFKKDSISFSKETQVLYKDSSEQRRLIEGIKESFLDWRFHFEPTGIFKQTMDTIPSLDGIYRELQSQNTIELITKNYLNEEVTEKIAYSIKDGLLYVSWRWNKEIFHLVFEKIE